MMGHKIQSDEISDFFAREMDLIEAELKNFISYFANQDGISEIEQQNGQKIISSLNVSINKFKDIFHEWKNIHQKLSHIQFLQPHDRDKFLDVTQKIQATYLNLQSLRSEMNLILEQSLENNIKFRK